ncbi:MAG: EamA family transporter RarD, partial [Spirochaetaceae bacterium]|nr:EamA family transporter RarD [Spirochaetaceae bacterium]
ESERERRRGLAYISAVYLAWGLMPAYWKLMRHIDPATILSHRAIWSAAFLLILIAAIYKPTGILEPLRDRKTLALTIVASVSLLVQWAAYLVAITTNRLVELSLGYFIYPIIVAFLGAIFLKERMTVPQIVAMVLASIGVLVKVLEHGGVPVLALTLAVSFSIYSIAKKKARTKSINSIFYEVLFMLPLALGYAAYAEASGAGYFVKPDLGSATLLIGGGILTAATLLLFAEGAKRIPIVVVGLLQYISPTMVLALGTLIYKEEFGSIHWLAFGIIWLAIAVSTIPAIGKNAKRT